MLKIHTDNTEYTSEDSIKRAIHEARERTDASLLLCCNQRGAARCVCNEWRRGAIEVTAAVELSYELVPLLARKKGWLVYSLL